MNKQTTFHYVTNPYINMRKEPKVKAELVSQAYFSEQVELLEESNGWMKIKTVVDGYTGWSKEGGIVSRSIPYPSPDAKGVKKASRLAAHVYETPDTIYGSLLTIPYESLLQVTDAGKKGDRWIEVELPDSRRSYIQSGDVADCGRSLDMNGICTLSLSFLGLPYTWGGRTSFGYDCSGFIQMLYRQMGVYLPRDAYQQIAWNGFIESPVEYLGPGDVIYFGASKHQIQHVGLYLNDDKFIHPCAVVENKPYIRISSLRDEMWNGSGYYPFVSGRKLKEKNE